MNRLDRIEADLARAKAADAQGPLPFAFAATSVVEAMEALLPLLREWDEAFEAWCAKDSGENEGRLHRAEKPLSAHLREDAK
jgi:hypothetical protein